MFQDAIIEDTSKKEEEPSKKINNSDALFPTRVPALLTTDEVIFELGKWVVQNANAEKCVEELNNRLSIAIKEYASLKSKNLDLENKTEQFKDSNIRYELKNKELSDMLSSVRKELKNSIFEQEKLTKDISNKEKDIAMLKKDISNKEKDIDMFKKDIKSKEKTINNLNKDITAKAVIVKQISEENDDLKSKLLFDLTIEKDEFENTPSPDDDTEIIREYPENVQDIIKVEDTTKKEDIICREYPENVQDIIKVEDTTKKEDIICFDKTDMTKTAFEDLLDEKK